MLVLWLHSTLTLPSGKPFCAPIGVEETTLEAFVERLSNDRIVTVTGMMLSPPDQHGVQIIRETWPFAIGISGVGTILNHRFRVCRVFDEAEEAA